MSEALALLMDYRGLLAKGLALTLAISCAGIVLGVLLGGLLALATTRRRRVFRMPAIVLIETMRALPFLLVLLLVHFGVQKYIGRLPGTVTGTVALSLYGAAYFAEALRAARAAVPKGQQEAASALGLRPAIAFVKVIAPQMIVVFASLGRVVSIMLLKESAVLSIITVPELTHTALRIQAMTFATVPTFILLALCYWCVVALLTSALARLERKASPKIRKAEMRRSSSHEIPSTGKPSSPWRRKRMSSPS